MRIGSETLVLANICAPNTDIPDFFENVFNRIDQTGIDRKIIGGDYNLVMDNIDRKGIGFHRHMKAIKIVKNLSDSIGLLDIWWQLRPHDLGYTWRRSFPHAIYERLDFFLISTSMEQLVDRVVKLPTYKSDHSPVRLVINESFHQRGKSYWKFNTRLLKDQEYLETINNLLDIQLEQSEYYKTRSFQKGKHLGENVMKLLSLIESCEDEKQSAIVFTVDFYKAFDTIKWEAIYCTLRRFNFGPGIIDLVKTINREIVCTVMNNGKWGDWFKIERGCRQGSPSSAILYILIAETLGEKIRNSKQIKGVWINGEEYKLGQYADDLWNLLNADNKNLDNLILVLDKFYKFSGQRVNCEKSIAFKIGPCKNSDFQYITKRMVVWTEEPVKILGFWIHPDPQVVQTRNFTEVLDKTEGILKQWKGRGLSWLGKICIINLSCFTIRSEISCAPTPHLEFLKRYKEITLNFLWSSGQHKMAYDRLIQDYQHGGLKFMDLECKAVALKAKWPMYFRGRDEKWFYRKTLDHRIWQNNTNSKDVERELGIEITDEQWAEKLTIPLRITNSTKLRDYQFRLINRCLTTNITRSKYTQISEECSFCNCHPETLKHLLWDCQKVQKLWTAFKKWTSSLLDDKNIAFNYADVVFNEYRGPQKILMNMLILIMKRYIYVTKCKGNQLNFMAYVTLIHCCDMGQNDTIGKIELNPSFVLSSDNTNCKNDIQLFLQLFDELCVNRDYH